MRPNFFHHLHPPTIPAEQARWRYTLGAGGTAIFLVFVLILTGALEMFYYIPSVSEAALSIQTITFLVPFGGLVRNLHYWSGQLLLIISVVHLLRVVFTGSYAPPRRFNYLMGLGLFVIIILLDFTGYILRWDTGIQWALVVGTNLIKTIPFFGNSFYQLLMGGSAPSQATLTRFYAWHLFGLMLPAIILVGWHAFRVRRDGGIAAPHPSPNLGFQNGGGTPTAQAAAGQVNGVAVERERISRFVLVQREALAMVLYSSGLVLLSVFAPAPLAAPIKHITDLSGGTTALRGEAHAPWFFLWMQQMLKWGDPFLWGIVAPLLLLAALALLPFLPKRKTLPTGLDTRHPDPLPPSPILTYKNGGGEERSGAARSENNLGHWFPKSNRLAQSILAVIALAVILLTIFGSLPTP